MLNGREIICKKCKNACEARKEKLNQSNYNDTIDSSRVVHSMTMSNESSWNYEDSSSLSNSNNNVHFNSASLKDGGGEEQLSFYHPGSALLSTTGKGNVSFSVDWKKEIVPIEEKDEALENFLSPLVLGAERKHFIQPFYPEELEDEVQGFDPLSQPVPRIQMKVSFYTFPGYVQRRF